MKELPEKEICEEYKNGSSLVSIARKYGVNEATIKYRLLKNKIKIRKQARPFKEWKKVHKTRYRGKVSSALLSCGFKYFKDMGFKDSDDICFKIMPDNEKKQFNIQFKVMQ